MGKDSVDAIRRTEDEKQRNDLIRYDLLDEKRLADALVLFHQARSLPRFDNYGSSFLAERIPLLKQSDPTERIASIGYVAGQPAPSIWLRELVEMVAAEFARLAENGDTPGIKRLMDDNEHFLKTWASSPVGSLIDEMVLTVAVAGTTAAANDAAAKAGFDDEVARLQGRKSRVDERIEWRKRRTPPITWILSAPREVCSRTSSSRQSPAGTLGFPSRSPATNSTGQTRGSRNCVQICWPRALSC